MKKILILVFILLFSGCAKDQATLEAEKKERAKKSKDAYAKAFITQGSGLYSEAAVLFAESCELGYAPSCNIVGNQYYNGQGVSKDYKMAKKYYEKGCILNHGSSCINAGSMYNSGKGVEQDVPRALKYALKACELGNGGACTALAIAYSKGKHLPVNYAKSRYYYSKGCYFGFKKACELKISLENSGLIK